MTDREPVGKTYDDQLTLIAETIVPLAEAMPADRYGFVPTLGTFSGARSFGEQAKHVATLIYLTAALVTEQRSPYGPGPHDNGPDDIRSKAEVIQFLKASLVYARSAMASLTAANHLESVPSAFGPMPRSAIAAGVAYHSFNHYGQMVVYARLNGIVPPASVQTGDEQAREMNPEGMS